MFGLVDRGAAGSEVHVAPRPAASPVARRGPGAPDAGELRSSSPWFGRPLPARGELSFRTGSGWTTEVTGAHPIIAIAKVGSSTRSDWRHPAVQLR